MYTFISSYSSFIRAKTTFHYSHVKSCPVSIPLQQISSPGQKLAFINAALPGITTTTTSLNNDEELRKAKTLLLESLRRLKKAKRLNARAPLTDVEIDPSSATEINRLAQAVESTALQFKPIYDAPQYLTGSWRLQYSTSSEITSLKKLPNWLFVLDQVFQNIDVENKRFVNIAAVSGLIAFRVVIGASFDAGKGDRANGRWIEVDFNHRTLEVESVLGIRIPGGRVFEKKIEQSSPRKPALETTYVDDEIRIGRGPKGNIFILTRDDEPVI